MRVLAVGSRSDPMYVGKAAKAVYDADHWKEYKG
jgi:hypothetical protein